MVIFYVFGIMVIIVFLYQISQLLRTINYNIERQINISADIREMIGRVNTNTSNAAEYLYSQSPEGKEEALRARIEDNKY